MLTKNSSKNWRVIVVILVVSLLALFVMLLPLAGAASIDSGVSDTVGITSNDDIASHRLIVQLASPALAEMTTIGHMPNGRLNLNSADAQAYIAQLKAEQNRFVSAMSAALPSASVATYINESGQPIEATYQIVYNGMSVDPGSMPRDEARRILSQIDGVKGVYLDFKHNPDLYASLPLINAPAIWSEAGGMENAGAGVKVASMDGGLHHAAPMFDGSGWSYPPGWPAAGLGDPANNTGKIIASRAYFRAWDPPSVGDENTWPGTQGTSHGTHTGSTAVGNQVVAEYLGVTETVSGVAPGAWAMSYRVFYNSVTNDGSFYTVEGIAALEDIVADGADVVNNSWGGGPGSVGGEFDPLDQTLINTYNAGVFVSMSAGNAGPGKGTGDHPSPEYINVAATTTDGTLASGRLNVTAPEPVPAELLSISYASASFGAPLPVGAVTGFDYITAKSVDPANFEGCDPWPADTFTGKAAVISRGACEFGVKVLNAEEAGADFVVVYNHEAGGDGLISMGAGAVGDQVTIPSIFIGYTNGLAVVDWYDVNGPSSALEVDTLAFQAGNTPDQVIAFSSRGPSAAQTLKPDIAAPGVNILAQGYTPNATGEARHLGWGQASGTSMASPHVAGSAAILRGLHPDWSNAEIKSALMSTSKYMDIYNFDGSPAQPLDMGAGRLDLTNASDPGVILDPPSVSFGLVDTDGSATVEVMITNITDMAETYAVSTLFTGNGFAISQTTPLTGVVVSPASIMLDPGETETLTVMFDAASSQGVGDNQGYIVLEGDNGHDAHMPAWARVLAPAPGADVLIIDNDASVTLGFPDYASYYTSTLENLGVSYDLWDADQNYGNPTTIPEAAVLAQYQAIIYFTGDNYYPDGTFTVSTPLTPLDMDRLTEYANMGGVIFAMGQDLAAVLDSANDDPAFFYGSVLGGSWLQDSVTGYGPPEQPVVPLATAPSALHDVWLDLGVPTAALVDLSGANEVPPVATDNSGSASFALNSVTNELSWEITVVADTAMEITGAHIHTGTVGMNGGVEVNLTPPDAPVVVTDTLTWNGMDVLTADQVAAAEDGGLYVNVHTTAHPSGELRAQVVVAVNGDGAGNQYYIDEIAPDPNYEPDGLGKRYPYAPLLTYPGMYNVEDGVVAMAHREQPTLENPGISYDGRSIYTTFGLEGVNNGVVATSREELMQAFMNWAMDEPGVTITDISDDYSDTSYVTVLQAEVSSNIDDTVGVWYRWDFGDGTDYTVPYASNIASHTYALCGEYTVRVEATDSWGNVVIGTQNINAVDNCTRLYYMPFIATN